MAATTTSSPESTGTRPKVASAKSYSRFEGTSSPLQKVDTRVRASSHSESSPITPHSALSSAVEPQAGEDDSIFAGREIVQSPTTPRPHESFDDLPIEIRSMTERWVKWLWHVIAPIELEY